MAVRAVQATNVLLEAAANAALGDGHVPAIPGTEFPRALGGSNIPAEVWAENTAGQLTVYADPERTLPRP